MNECRSNEDGDVVDDDVVVQMKSFVGNNSHHNLKKAMLER